MIIFNHVFCFNGWKNIDKTSFPLKKCIRFLAISDLLFNAFSLFPRNVTRRLKISEATLTAVNASFTTRKLRDYAITFGIDVARANCR